MNSRFSLSLVVSTSFGSGIEYSEQFSVSSHIPNKCISQGHGEIEILAQSDKIGGYGQETNVFSSNNSATETTAL